MIRLEVNTEGVRIVPIQIYSASRGGFRGENWLRTRRDFSLLLGA